MDFVFRRMSISVRRIVHKKKNVWHMWYKSLQKLFDVLKNQQVTLEWEERGLTLQR